MRSRIVAQYAALRYQAAPHRAQHQFGRAVQIQLVHDPPAMRLHGVEAEVEPVGDVLVAVAFRQKRVNLAFAIRQEFETVADLTCVLQTRETIGEQPSYTRAEIG